MSYTPKVWGAIDTILISDMNHLETQKEEIDAGLVAHDAAGHALYYDKSTLESHFWNTGNDGEGSGLNVDTLAGIHAAAIQGGVPQGLMIFWNPNIALTARWEFCDGSNGTYDMRNRFPIGASGTLAVGTAIGNATITLEGDIAVAGHTLTTEEIYHTHAYLEQSLEDSIYEPWNTGHLQGVNQTSGQITTYVGAGAPGYGVHTHPGTFTGAAYDNLPVYKYLAIVRKT